jgi:DNA-binding protein H-NS
MPTYQQILSQIESLKIEAEKARQEEVKSAIETVRRLIRENNLSAADCGFARKGRASAGNSRVKAKYRDPVSGQTWSGRGLTPKWLQEAIASGRRKEDFLI